MKFRALRSSLEILFLYFVTPAGRYRTANRMDKLLIGIAVPFIGVVIHNVIHSFTYFGQAGRFFHMLAVSGAVSTVPLYFAHILKPVLLDKLSEKNFFNFGIVKRCPVIAS